MDQKLALDVASLIISQFITRSDKIKSTIHKEPIQRECLVEEVDIKTKWKSYSKQITDLLDAKNSLFDELSKQHDEQIEQISIEKQAVSNILTYLLELLIELKDKCNFESSNELKSLVSELYNEFQALDKQLTEKNLLINQLEKNLKLIESNHCEEIESMDSVVGGLREEILEKDTTIEKLNGIKSDFVKNLTEIREHVEIIRFDSIKVYESGTLEISSFKDAILEVVGELMGQNESMRDLNRELESEVDSKLEIIKNLENRVTEFTTKLSDLEADNQKRVLDLLDENEAIIKKVNEANEAQISDLREKIDQTNCERSTEKGLMQRRILELEEQVGRLNHELERLKEETIQCSPQSKKSRTGSIMADHSRNIIDTLPVRVVFTGYRDPNGPKSIKHLGGLVERLGGVVHITHVIAPKCCCSIKVLAGSLTSKWLVGEDWLLQSAAAGKFLPESEFDGRKYDERPFRCKIFSMTQAFQTQQHRLQFDPACCKTLIENLGKGKLTRDDLESADYILVSDSEPTDQKRITIGTFLSMIPGYQAKSNYR